MAGLKFPVFQLIKSPTSNGKSQGGPNYKASYVRKDGVDIKTIVQFDVNEPSIQKDIESPINTQYEILILKERYTTVERYNIAKPLFQYQYDFLKDLLNKYNIMQNFELIYMPSKKVTVENAFTLKRYVEIIDINNPVPVAPFHNTTDNSVLVPYDSVKSKAKLAFTSSMEHYLIAKKE